MEAKKSHQRFTEDFKVEAVIAERRGYAEAHATLAGDHQLNGWVE